MRKDLIEPELANNYSKLKEIEEENLLSNVKELTTMFGTSVSVTLMQDTYNFVEKELKDITDGISEFNEEANLRIINGVFTRTTAARLLLELVESSKMIHSYETKISSNKLNCESCKN